MESDALPQAPPRASTAWLWLTLLPIGFGTWVPVVAGLRARRARWTGFGVVIVAAAVTALVLPDAEDGGLTDPAGVLMFGSWFAGIGWTIACRKAYGLRAGAFDSRVEHEVRVGIKDDQRRQAHRLAASDPAAAVRRGVGRPDLPGSDHGWVVDVNHAPIGVLQTLPGIDAETARRVVATREELGTFSSVDDLAFVLDLPAEPLRRLHELAVALPD